MKKLLLLFCASVLCLSQTFAADDLQFGITAGLNVSSFNDGDLSSKAGFNVGGKVEYDIAAPWFVEGSVLLSGRGFKFDSDDLDYKVNLWYLHIPINFGYKFDLTDQLVIAPKAGLFAGLGLWGSDDDDNNPFTDYEDEVHGFKFGHNISRGDFGFALGVNLWVVEHMEVSTGYEWGVVDCWSNGGNYDSHSRNWYLNLAFLF